MSVPTQKTTIVSYRGSSFIALSSYKYMFMMNKPHDLLQARDMIISA